MITVDPKERIRVAFFLQRKVIIQVSARLSGTDAMGFRALSDASGLFLPMRRTAAPVP